MPAFLNSVSRRHYHVCRVTTRPEETPLQFKAVVYEVLTCFIQRTVETAVRNAPFHQFCVSTPERQ